jgi:hypothetical protein
MPSFPCGEDFSCPESNVSFVELLCKIRGLKFLQKITISLFLRSNLQLQQKHYKYEFWMGIFSKKFNSC